MTKNSKIGLPPRRKKVSTTLRPGDRIKIYSVMNPRRNFKCEATVKSVAPMYSGGDPMIWPDVPGGAVHPDACELIESATLKEAGL